MKKLCLLGVLVCAVVLNGMEQSYYKTLPKELQQEILSTALISSKNLTEAINALKNASMLHGVQFDKLFDNLEDFTKIAHRLADQFNVSTWEVSFAFKKTPIAERYMDLIEKAVPGSARYNNEYGLLVSSGITRSDYLNKLIKEGVDVNATYVLYRDSLLTLSTKSIDNVDLIKLLLRSGANPYYKNSAGKTTLDAIKTEYLLNSEKLIEVLEEAMQKYPIK